MFANNLDNGQPLEPQQAGQPGVDLPDEGGQASGSPEWQAAVEALRSEFRAEQEKTFQRLRDSLGDRDKKIRDEIAQERAKLDRLKAAANLSDDWYNAQLERRTSEIAERYMDQDDDPAQDQHLAPAQPPAIPAEQGRALRKTVDQILVETGVKIYDDDPEYQELVRAEASRNMSLDEYVAEYKKAIDRKAIRTKTVVSPPNGTNPNARIPGPSGGSQGALMTQYQSEVTQYRPGSEEVLQIRRKYRRMGLDV